MAQLVTVTNNGNGLTWLSFKSIDLEHNHQGSFDRDTFSADHHGRIAMNTITLQTTLTNADWKTSDQTGVVAIWHLDVLSINKMIFITLVDHHHHRRITEITGIEIEIIIDPGPCDGIQGIRA